MALKKTWWTASTLALLVATLASCSFSVPDLVSTVLGAQATSEPSTYADPFAYCAAVQDIDQPDARYVGEAVPEAIGNALKKASGAAADTPLDLFLKGSAWRCMGGQVYGCFVGANIPCESKANTDRTPTQEAIDFCKAQPNADVIPAVAAGRETVYEWRCKNGTPEIARQTLNVDARGYAAEFWYPLSAQ